MQKHTQCNSFGKTDLYLMMTMYDQNMSYRERYVHMNKFALEPVIHIYKTTNNAAGCLSTTSFHLLVQDHLEEPYIIPLEGYILQDPTHRLH